LAATVLWVRVAVPPLFQNPPTALSFWVST
jgi:hypothetical protein